MGSSFPGSSAPTLPSVPAPIDDRGGWALALLLAATFTIRAIHPSQPIVENYVGRQVPTAMVARNLERGSGFFRPELDTGPFPNLFLVEPPIYAQAVASIRASIELVVGFELEPTGRLVSAAATTLGAWGLFGLVRRREGRAVALLAVASYGALPVMIRYGRAFQPDALMVGCILAGLRGWDEFDESGRARWGFFGGFVLAVGLALKITSAWVLIPFVLILRRWPIAWRVLAAAAMLAPAFAWYVYAWGEVARPEAGSLASSDNAAIWIRTLDLSSWLRLGTWSSIGWGLVIRSFTPVGFVLAMLGFIGKPRLDRVWAGWAVGFVSSVLVLAAKWHHAYYWMVVAPLAAVGVARGFVWLGSRGEVGRVAGLTLGSFFLTLCGLQSASTFRTPVEWRGIEAAAQAVREQTDADAPLIATEALLYLSDRRGCRLEFDPTAAGRAAGEWGGKLPDPPDPLTLVWFYRSAGDFRVPAVGNAWEAFNHGMANCRVADSGPVEPGSRRDAWRRAVRTRPGTVILVDRPDLLIAELH